MKGTVLGDMEQGEGIRDLRDKGKGTRDEEERIKGKTEVEFDTKDQVLFAYLQTCIHVNLHTCI